MRAQSQEVEASSSQPVFKIVASFDGTNGASPAAGLLQGPNGNFYGTTEYGGTGSACEPTCGTVFEVTAAGKLTRLHSFDASDGALPVAGLVQGADGNFYGTTRGSTSYDECDYSCGTVFKITPAGALTTLYVFGQAGRGDGVHPGAGLVQGTDGNFYGTAEWGGNYIGNCIGSPYNLAVGCGTVFKVTAEGKLTTLHDFNFSDGYDPLAGLVQGTDGNFYGTTSEGGVYANPCLSYGCGTVFKITPEGKLTTLHSFDGTDGANPSAALTQGTNGSFYGTALSGGAHGEGTVFSLSVGLGTFVETRPSFGAVGTTVEILGDNLMDITSVTFNGTAAAFKVVSCSEITATVPASATTGKVEVKTRSGTLSSNIVFRVIS